MTSVQRSKVSSLHLDISLQSENEIKKAMASNSKALKNASFAFLVHESFGKIQTVLYVTRPRLPSFRSAANIALFDISLRFIR